MKLFCFWVECCLVQGLALRSEDGKLLPFLSPASDLGPGFIPLRDSFNHEIQLVASQDCHICSSESFRVYVEETVQFDVSWVRGWGEREFLSRSSFFLLALHRTSFVSCVCLVRTEVGLTLPLRVLFVCLRLVGTEKVLTHLTALFLSVCWENRERLKIAAMMAWL